MTRIAREEFMKLAKIAALEVPEDRVDAAIRQLEHRLTYVTQLEAIIAQQVTLPVEPSVCSTTPLRSDLPAVTDPAPLLALAPERIENYVVVPVIIK